MTKPTRVAILEPFFGGSHKAFIDGLRGHSKHEFTLFSLPGRHWKWHMRYFPMTIPSGALHEHSTILASSYTDLAAVCGYHPTIAQARKILYFHENQLTYPLQKPLQKNAQQDLHFAMTHMTSIDLADRVFFNSHFHLDEFLDASHKFWHKTLRGEAHSWHRRNQHKWDVLYQGIEKNPEPKTKRTGPLCLLWNQRWEHDKNPEWIFAQLRELNIDFRLIVCGESYRHAPAIFSQLTEWFGEKLIHLGFAKDRRHYWQLLRQADVVLSSANHEFYGLAIQEAIASGCHPLLPRRLVYPELYDDMSLYGDAIEFREKTTQLANELPRLRTTDLIEKVRFWSSVIADWDTCLANESSI